VKEMRSERLIWLRVCEGREATVRTLILFFSKTRSDWKVWAVMTHVLTHVSEEVFGFCMEWNEEGRRRQLPQSRQEKVVAADLVGSDWIQVKEANFPSEYWV
jgi:hypothetical protein